MNQKQLNTAISHPSRYFTWKEALYLPQWDMYAEPTPTQAAEIAFLAIRMDTVRELLGCPLRVTSWLRPGVEGKGDYNALVGGARNSMHKMGAAVDVVPVGKPVEQCFRKIGPFLADLGLRMESIKRADGSLRGWLHFDTRTVEHGHTRIFAVP